MEFINLLLFELGALAQVCLFWPRFNRDNREYYKAGVTIAAFIAVPLFLLSFLRSVLPALLRGEIGLMEMLVAPLSLLILITLISAFFVSVLLYGVGKARFIVDEMLLVSVVSICCASVLVFFTMTPLSIIVLLGGSMFVVVPLLLKIELPNFVQATLYVLYVFMTVLLGWWIYAGTVHDFIAGKDWTTIGMGTALMLGFIITYFLVIISTPFIFFLSFLGIIPALFELLTRVRTFRGIHDEALLWAELYSLYYSRWYQKKQYHPLLLVAVIGFICASFVGGVLFHIENGILIGGTLSVVMLLNEGLARRTTIRVNAKE